MAISRRRRLLSIFAMFLGVALLATGCAKEEPKPTPTPTKTAIFSSEEAALQAAIDAYQEFNAAYDAITATGIAEFETLKDLVTDDYYTYVSSDTSFEDRGVHTEGTSSFDTASVVSFEQDRSEATLVMKLCRDVSNVKIVDSEGEDVSSEDRRIRFPYEVTVVTNSADEFLISNTKTWAGENFCAQ